MSPLVSILIMLAALTGASAGVAVPPQPVQSTNVSTSVSPVVGTTVVTSAEFIGDPFLPEQAQENVLVVPAPDLPAENQAELTEDLSIMCRIFDKSVPAAGGSGGFAYGDRGDSLRWVIGQQSRGTQGLYLDGYGALFFIRVDYPLVPTQKEDAGQGKPKEAVDSVWSQTVREMSGQPGDEPQGARNAPAYDAQKVENLKKTLVKTLAHASNIRMRRPQDVITLVVGPLDDNRTSSYSRRLGGRGTTTTLQYGRSSSSSSAGGATSAPAAAPALLVLRVAKTDVDAFAKGQLTLAQFTDKVQIISTPIEQGPPTAGAPTTGLRTR